MSEVETTTRDSVPYVLRALANVWDNWCGLPEPIAMRATTSNGIATVEVPDLAAVKQWNRALGGTSNPTSSCYPDRGPIHGVQVWSWHGWTVSISADEEDGPRDPEGRTIVHSLDEDES
jgi:hypothetical protein